MKCTIVDVFAETQLAGNQLAVMRDIGALAADAMQALALEMNFSETTFVVDEKPGRARVRIFTPDRELPFAGHPTLGTAWVLTGGRGGVVLELDAGDVAVAFDETGVGWMTPPEVALGDRVDVETAARLVGLAPADLDERFDPRHAVVGPHFVLIGVKDLATLKRARVDATVRDSLAGTDLLGTFVFTPESYDHAADFAARMFFDARGPREDPATGSANTAFAAYLRDLGTTGRLVVEQGFEIGRPSRLYLDVATTIRVGGRVQAVLDGTIVDPSRGTGASWLARWRE